MQIAIDGPASAGKSTIAKLIAKNLKFVYCDTGAMYRTVTLLAKKNDVGYGDTLDILKLMSEHKIHFLNKEDGQHVYLDDEDVSDTIRTEDITNNVSQVSAIKEVRTELVKMQRDMANNIDIVMDGRDIGTTVLPNAEVKIFLIASVEVRAQRRYKENLERGIKTPLKELQDEIAARDYKDSHREVSPLRKASDAIEIDSSDMTIEQVVKKVTEIVNEKK
ncbi:(d)CMP kinase [Companilactobacillus alimentarius]|uniref:Cytidylate kinase n=1 Tax=Companilactobacillus alimentarius DSM 20249 TaxID=1423720 RepID=A0A2K9HMA2_9LACO|nr:(d)CMP kinase [Companilactobacillus alimentarius]AUI71113.1 cytidylate kinase [Companilactobacillus alimentarius DSM 20249]KRK75237.1 cytidylate kinase [Companilactobacillus alimentarius DSM 20249]MDT6951625.1 (d)CMP kinase [Companilactobacillus alimentarius]GEO43984.1 cytidylate kinase [Companilactobacillus alimentarius]